jgi:hypothetical protein
VRYSLVVVGAVGDFWRSKTMTAPVDPIETIFWHRRLTTKTRFAAMRRASSLVSLLVAERWRIATRVI